MNGMNGNVGSQTFSHEMANWGLLEELKRSD